MARQVDPALVARGNWGEVRFAWRADGTMPAKIFLLEECPSQDAPKILELFQRMASFGLIQNGRKFKRIEGVIHEFKANQVRVSCYQVDRCWYLLHGFIKQQDDWPSGELQRARNLLHEHAELLGLKLKAE